MNSGLGILRDIHEAAESRFIAKRTRQQLLSVVAHAQMTLFLVDRNRNLTLIEGDPIWNLENDGGSGGECANSRTMADKFIEQNVYDIFYRSNEAYPRDKIPDSLKPLEDIFTGKTMEDTYEHSIHGRWYRTRFPPVFEEKDSGHHGNTVFIDGVIGVTMDVTELKVSAVPSYQFGSY